MKKMVSIITPSYNCAKFISQTIDSVLAQTYQDWEMIIVDDCSPDNANEIIADYCKKDSRIKLIKLGQNVGTALAKNKAIEKANGRYIAFLDSDDIWLAKKLARQIDFMRKNNYPISFTSYALIDKNGRAKNNTIRAVKSLNLQQYLKNTIIGFSTAMIDTKLVKTELKFLDMGTREDVNLWIKLFKNGYQAYGLDELLAKYRVHSGSISANKIKAAQQIWRLYFKIHKLGLTRSIYYFCFYAYNAIKKRIKKS